MNTVVSPRITAPLPRLLSSVVVRSSVALLSSSALLCVAGCASSDLEDKDVYATQVEPGLGAKGVTKPQGTGQTPAMPGTTPTPPPPATTPATPPTTPPTPPTPPSGGLSAACADIETRIFKTRCDESFCHGSPGSPAAAYSDFVNPTNLAAAVKDVPAKGNCSNLKLVDSQNPANSALLKVILPTPQPCVSTQMPVGDPLSAADAACMTEWVNAVASGAI